jgi:hypothetical protein
MRVAVQVKVPASLDRLPDTLARRQPVFLKKLADGVADEISTQAPGGPAGKIGRSWRGELLSADESQVVSSQPVRKRWMSAPTSTHGILGAATAGR